MKLTRLAEAKSFTPPGHFDMKTLNLQSAGPSGHLTMVRSVFLPGGGAEYTAMPRESGMETICYVLDGEMTVTTDEEAIILRPGDSIFFGPGEGRSLRNDTNLPATLLIIIGK